MTRARRAAGVALLALSGCSLGAHDQPRQASGDANAVAATIQALDQATRAHDYRGICHELFTAGARRRAGGGDCESLVRSASAGLHRPRIEILSIHIRGSRATARVRSSAAGQRPLVDEVELAREGGGYRIDALGG